MLLLTLISLLVFHIITVQSVFEAVNVPNGWSVARAPHPEQPLKLRIALKQRSIDEFERRLLEISTPGHLLYGKHLQGHEIEALLQPTEESSMAVFDWLKECGVRDVEHDKEWINFKTNVETANKMLNTSFLWYKHDQDKTLALRTQKYSVPKHITEHLELIQPTTRFGAPIPLRSTIHKVKILSEQNGLGSAPSVNATCNNTITPSCLFDLYNIRYQADPNSGSKLGYASFLEEYTRYEDLELFEPHFAPWATGQNFSFVSINGGQNDQNARTQTSTEGNLDGQYAVSIAYPLEVTEFSVGGRGPLVPDLDAPTLKDNSNEPYLDYLTGLMKLPNHQIPQVLSHSYGEDEQSVPTSYNKKVCNLFGQLAARGISIIFSSGDVGVGDACLSNDGKNKTEFQPAFPAACPWVTSVGSTYRLSPEIAASFSGGGFSRIYERPKWQDAAVSRYLAQMNGTFRGLFNAHGRGFPDVSAQGVDFTIYDKGFKSFASGTSASAPTFAGMIALLNSARLSAGKTPLGFLNPWLYGMGCEAFNDITKGRNYGCSGFSASTGTPNGSPRVVGAGFSALEGWDPVTGLGTPDFGKMLEFAAPGAKNLGGPAQGFGGNTTRVEGRHGTPPHVAGKKAGELCEEPGRKHPGPGRRGGPRKWPCPPKK